MVSIEYSEAAVEVLEILNELEDKEFNKIPTRVINFFEECKSKTYNPKIDYTAEVESLNLKEKTREILAGIYLDYLCPEIDKEEYVKKIRINNYKHEEELKKKYDVDNIFKNRKDYNIVLFGIKYDDSFDKQKLDKYKNIHFLGSRDYKVLKNYASKFSVCTIPFLINDITKATSPVKLFEYMALHKPIVTTAMHECKKYKSVMIAHNKEEFVELIDKAINMDLESDKKYFDLLDKEALLRYRPERNCHTYTCGDYENYMFGGKHEKGICTRIGSGYDGRDVCRLCRRQQRHHQGRYRRLPHR